MTAARIGRRGAITMLAGAAAQPFTARAEKVRKLGVLLYSLGDENFRFMRRGLADLGHGEGRNLVLEVRSAEGKPERLAGLAFGLTLPQSLIIRADDIIE